MQLLNQLFFHLLLAPLQVVSVLALLVLVGLGRGGRVEQDAVAHAEGRALVEQLVEQVEALGAVDLAGRLGGVDLDVGFGFLEMRRFRL